MQATARRLSVVSATLPARRRLIRAVRRLRTSPVKLSWNPKSIATFLRTEPVLPHPEDTEFVFAFPVGSASGCLRVFPHGSQIALSLSASTTDEPFATWRFDCDSLTVNDEIPEEGGPVLVAVAFVGGSGARCHITISPEGDTFEVGTFFIASAQ